MDNKINYNYSLEFTSRNANSNDTVVDVRLAFENPLSDADVVRYVNTWLTAVGHKNIVCRMGE